LDPPSHGLCRTRGTRCRACIPSSLRALSSDLGSGVVGTGVSQQHFVLS
jgi:hypothetical protein